MFFRREETVADSDLLIEVRRTTPPSISMAHMHREGYVPHTVHSLRPPSSAAAAPLGKPWTAPEPSLKRLPNLRCLLDLLQKHPCHVWAVLRHSHPNSTYPYHCLPFTQSRTYIAAVFLCDPYFSLSLLLPFTPIPPSVLSLQYLLPSCLDTSIAKMGINNPLPSSMACKSNLSDIPRTRVALPSQPQPSSAGHPGLGTTGCYAARNKTIQK